jgi:hypothetical protein
MTDVYISNNGSVFSFQPVTKAGKDWITENVQTESWQWLGDTLAIESRFAAQLADGMISAGLDIE